MEAIGLGVQDQPQVLSQPGIHYSLSQINTHKLKSANPDAPTLDFLAALRRRLALTCLPSRSGRADTKQATNQKTLTVVTFQISRLRIRGPPLSAEHASVATGTRRAQKTRSGWGLMCGAASPGWQNHYSGSWLLVGTTTPTDGVECSR